MRAMMANMGADMHVFFSDLQVFGEAASSAASSFGIRAAAAETANWTESEGAMPTAKAKAKAASAAAAKAKVVLGAAGPK